MQTTGKIEHRGMGPGAWALVADTGETYELRNAPSELCQAGLKVKLKGEVRRDIMTFAMIGPVFEVQSFEVIGE
ncbi:hypothetical protein [Spirulina subsalsa]|uniref:hypothetical protein n=1 Tax=Spirulina subsalsa TaxID=54311 RepID=UPI0003104569|nr:hypothetical protein [Spirulina subsalsa]